MVPWRKLESTQLPGGEELTLWQRGDEYAVRAGSVELMSTRQHASEEALARFGCDGLGPNPTVLLGGLGLGFTLRAALDLLPATAAVVVVEIAPAIAEWVRGPLGVGDLLEDARVRLVFADVVAFLRDADRRFDAILLDVDNGPAPATQASNAWLCSIEGLRAAARSLRPGGRAIVWSASDDALFARRMEGAGFAVRTEQVRAHQSGGRSQGARHALLIGTLRPTR